MARPLARPADLIPPGAFEAPFACCAPAGGPSWWHDRPDLPAGSAQAYFASVRGHFGNSIRWMCLRHGIGPGHQGLAGAVSRHRGVWRQRGGVPRRRSAERAGMVGKPRRHPGHGPFPGFSAPAAAPASLLEQQAVANAPPPAPNAMQAEAAHARLPASWLPASVAAGVCTRRPASVDRAARLPGTANTVMSDARGRSMASPAVLIRAD